MRTVVCANCHVEYYFKGDGKYLTFPWDNGTRIEDILSYYEEDGFKDWAYPDTDTPCLRRNTPSLSSLLRKHTLRGWRCLCRLPHALRPRWRRQVLFA